MRGINRLFTRLLNFTAKRRGDERLQEEMQEHLRRRRKRTSAPA